MALDRDINEATSPVVPQMMMKDAFDYTDKAIYRALAGGVTSSLLLHGSADMIGGQAVVIKTKYGLDRDQMLFPGAPQSIKFASGENPKRVFGDRKQLPSTRMGNFEVMREAFTQAKDYQRQWDEYNEKVKKGDKAASPPKKDLKLEAAVKGRKPKLRCKHRNRCWRCGRPRGYLRKFGVCRLCFRQLALNGEIPGVIKASW